MVKPFLVVAVGAVAAAGCAVDGEEDARLWREVRDAGVIEQPSAPAPGATLDAAGAMRLANARHEALAIEGEGYVRALMDRRRAAAAFLPRLFFSPSVFFEDRVDRESENFGLDAPLEGSLDVNPVSDEAAVRVAERTAEERRSRLLALQDDVLLDAARTLLGVVLAERRVDVLRASLGVQEARAEDARVRRDAGLARPLDAALAESQAAETRVALLDADVDVRQGRALLEFLVDAPLRGVALDDALEVPDAPPEVERFVAAAAARREDVIAAEAAVRAAQAGVEAAYGQWWPSISADVTAFLKHDSQETAPDWTSVIEVSVPLFTAGVVEADVRIALSFLREARERLSLARRIVRREVLEAWADFDASRRRIEAIEVRLAAATSAFDQAEGLWSAGLATNLERLVAQDQRLAAELDLAGAQVERKLGWLALARAGGSLHETIGLDRGASRRDDGEPRAQAR